MKRHKKTPGWRLRRQCEVVIEGLKAPAFLLFPALKLSGFYQRGFLNASEVICREYTAEFEKLPPAFEGYRLLVVSDLHIDSPLPIVDRVRTLAKGLSFDLLLLLGDFRRRIFGTHRPAVEETARLLAELRPKDRCLAVRGNHDSPELMEELSELGVEVLINRNVMITRQAQAIWVVGIDDPHYDQADDLAAAVEGAPTDGFKILLSHTSELFQQAAAVGIDFYLCGHTHGGQICLRNGRPIITNVRTPRSWSHGFWRYKNMTGYTTSGVGCSSVPVRFNCPPEIVLLTLQKWEKP